MDGILLEFERLLNAHALERELEEFIAAHYRLMLGARYNRIETQLWLRFPTLDIGNRDRRLDVFLRNAVTADWELFELKKNVDITRTVRDVPVLRSEVYSAIQQLLNYKRILNQDHVKRQLAEEGIEYCEPEMRLVIGGTPTISQDQWRWLRSTIQGSVKLITYDDIRREMEERCSLVQDITTRRA
ncbi:DUF4263 domain-containing protein [Candidatus Bipolaricaulota bacterium]|nr:DUF4263 domain-containing protein [Candidatus Bipolaricaulota bacterium]